MNVQEIPISKIHVLPNRHRKVADTLATRDGRKKMEELAESIKVRLINPITVTEREDGDYDLVAGEHRLYVFDKVLKRTTIPASLESSLTEYDKGFLELEENIRRTDMTPAERMSAVAKLHKMRSEKDPAWTQAQTAALIGSRRRADVTEAIALSQIVEHFPELAKAKNVNQLKSWADAKSAQILRVDKVKRDAAADPRVKTVEERIWLGDSVERIKEVPDNFCRLILTDPPFGVNYNDKVSGTIGSLTDYEDSVDDYERLLSMAPDLYRVLKPDGFLIWFFGISWYQRCKDVFTSAGFLVDEIPVVWDRSAGKCWTRRPDRYFARAYDVALMCIKGEPQIIRRNQHNVIHATPVSTSEREAVVERPIELYRPFIERLTVPGERVVDFFCGAGGVPAAAAGLQRDFFAIEQNESRRAIAINKVLAHLPK